MWALIVAGAVAELTDTDPAGRFHPDLQWVACDATVKVGYTYANGTFAAPAAPVQTTAQLAAAVRAQRDALMNACDWTQVTDSPLPPETKAAWAAYRTALRNVPESAGFPQTITWPVAPGAPT